MRSPTSLAEFWAQRIDRSASLNDDQRIVGISSKQTADKSSSAYVLTGFASYGLADSSKNIGTLYALYLLKNYQGFGLGSALYRHVLDELRTTGLQKLSIEVDSENIKAQNFYVKQGARKTESNLRLLVYEHDLQC